MAVDNKHLPVCLTVAGLDPSGGAGVIADIKTFTAFDCFATSAITSVTFQNTVGVFGAINQTAESVRGQVEPILDDFSVAALKTGMLPTHEIIEETARLVKTNNLKNLVVDPVVRSTSGYDLIDDAALRALIENLFPLASIITPNLPEAERIVGMTIQNENDVHKAAGVMQSMGAANVLIKGGHLTGNKSLPQKANDFLFESGRASLLEADWIDTKSTHGTGCTLSAAICANLAHGKSLAESVAIGKQFVTAAIRHSPNIGHGHPPVNSGIRF